MLGDRERTAQVMAGPGITKIAKMAKNCGFWPTFTIGGGKILVADHGEVTHAESSKSTYLQGNRSHLAVASTRWFAGRNRIAWTRRLNVRSARANVAFGWNRGLGREIFSTALIGEGQGRCDANEPVRNDRQGRELRFSSELVESRRSLITDGLELIGHGLKTAANGLNLYIRSRRLATPLVECVADARSEPARRSTVNTPQAESLNGEGDGLEERLRSFATPTLALGSREQAAHEFPPPADSVQAPWRFQARVAGPSAAGRS